MGEYNPQKSLIDLMNNRKHQAPKKGKRNVYSVNLISIDCKHVLKYNTTHNKYYINSIYIK